MTNEAKAFYTGGGIWIAEVKIKGNEYGVVNSEYPEYFGIYEYTEEDGQYYPEDMLLDQHKDELSEENKKIYEKLLLALAKR